MASLVPCRVRMADKVLWTEQAFAIEALHAPRSRAGVGFGKNKTLAKKKKEKSKQDLGTGRSIRVAL